MASSLAAKIRAEFGITPELLEGHGGVYELIVDDSVVYSNQSTCGQFPTDEVIFKEIRKFQEPLPKEGRTATVDDGEDASGDGLA